MIACGAGVPVGHAPAGVEHVDRIVANALDQQPEALLAFEQRAFLLALGGDVAGDLGEADQLALVVADRVDDDMGEEARAVLAHAPAFAFEPAFLGRGR